MAVPNFFPLFNIFVMLLASTTVLDFLPIALEKKRIKSTYSLNTQNRNYKYITKNSKAIQSFHFAVLHQCCTLQHFYFLYNKYYIGTYVSQHTRIHTCIDVLNKYLSYIYKNSKNVNQKKPSSSKKEKPKYYMLF